MLKNVVGKALKKAIKNTYKKAVMDAKAEGNFETMHKVGAERVKEVLGVQDELESGRGALGAKTEKMRFAYIQQFPNVDENGEETVEEDVTDFIFKSTLRGGRCELSVINTKLGGQIEETVAAVAE